MATNIVAGAARTAALIFVLTGCAQGEVRFGKNVYVGGHDFSHQTFDRNHRAVVHLYDHEPRNAGCRMRADKAGGSVKTCHLRRLR
ncbi:hypothetical protein [Methylocystis parvus]|uniref:Uncharacterized protein n=1 Tax=Methylocystis parvus TaxID=134 RepID=A0A6B8M1T2_9HYPH|nr:hypothetical protein [Methylocystis parvus]QGM96821.1 hypothetical protein F7D14_04575 [Methylocystis parvus]WBJ99301.1 hypothetical protein MMG94_15050 [Methylocystis parvus OBBP]